MASPQSEAIRQMLREQKEAAKKGAPSIEEQRRQLDYLGGFSPLESDVTVEKTRIAGVPGEWISTPDARKDRVLFYLHGGAYCFGSCDSHRGLVSRLARACGSRALLIEYRLAPEHPFPAALEDSTAAYRELIRSGVRPGKPGDRGRFGGRRPHDGHPAHPAGRGGPLPPRRCSSPPGPTWKGRGSR